MIGCDRIGAVLFICGYSYVSDYSRGVEFEMRGWIESYRFLRRIKLILSLILITFLILTVGLQFKIFKSSFSTSSTRAEAEAEEQLFAPKLWTISPTFPIYKDRMSDKVFR